MSPFFDKEADITISTGGNLPHWHQEQKIQYITFRLADSLPQSKIRELKQQISQFEKDHPRPWTPEIKQKYWATVGRREQQMLDNGYGSCLLASESVRAVVAATLHHHDGTSYRLIAYVIMPNHVHMLLCPAPDVSISTILHSIKRYSARQINLHAATSGPVWQRESFDRIVRSEEQLKHCISYIRSNPRHLRPHQYTLYVR